MEFINNPEKDAAKAKEVEHERARVICDARTAGFKIKTSRDFTDVFMIDEDGQIDGIRLFNNGQGADLFDLQRNGGATMVNGIEEVHKMCFASKKLKI